MSALNLRFCTTPSKDAGSYKLLELSADLAKLVESSTGRTMTIRGETTEDAVLCTPDKTYSLRSVVLSNSVLVVTAPSSSTGSGDDVVIRDQLHEFLEAVPCIPNLHKLNGLLRGKVYDEGHEDDEDDFDEEGKRPTKKRKFTYQDAKDMLQASDLELEQGLKDKRILHFRGCLRPIAPSHLNTILELLLNALVLLSLPHEAASTEDLLAALEDEHEINRDVARQVMAWFGEVNDRYWKMDVQATVREIGLGILRAYRHEPIPEEEFARKWRTSVGDTFEPVVQLKLLSGNYLTMPSTTSLLPVPELVYFPSSELPSDPAARFADLFLSRTRWRADEIASFLTDIVVDNKDRDKLLLKYARAVTDSEGVWYTTKVKLQ